MTEKRRQPDYYAILGVSPTASHEEIKKARAQWARLLHEDKLAGFDEGGKKRAERKLAEINDAYDTIGNPENRRRYDREVEAEKYELRQRQEQERVDAEKKSQYLRIQELFKKGDIEGAVREAKSLYARFPDDADCQNNYAALLYEWATRLAEKGKLKEAAAQLRQAAEHTLDDELKTRIRADLELLRAKGEDATAPPTPSALRKKMPVLAKWVVGVLFIIVAITAWRNIASNSYPTRQSPSANGSPSSQIKIPQTTEKITIDSLTKNLPYGYRNAGRFQAIEKTYNVSFDDAWTAANKVISEQREAIITSDRDKGILIGQGGGMGVKHWTAATIEKITEYSVKITSKTAYISSNGVDSFGWIIHKNLEKEIKSKGKQPTHRPESPQIPAQMPSQMPSQIKIPQTTEKITIDSLTRNILDTDYFVAKSKIFDASFDIVWSAASEYLKKDHVIDIFDTSFDIDISDRNKGILTTKRMISTKQITSSLPSFLRASPTSPKTYKISYQTFILIEKISEDSTKVTVKRFSYNYFQNEWYKPWGRSFGEIDLGGIEKEIKKNGKEAGKTR